MLDAIFSLGPNVLIGIAAILLVGLGAIAAYSGLQARNLEHRMDVVASERNRLRGADAKNTGLRDDQKAFMRDIVERLNLRHHLGQDNAKKWLVAAGFRGPQAEVTFLFARAACGIMFFLGTLVYLFFIANLGYSRTTCLAIALCAALLGLWAPRIWLSNIANKRQEQIKRAWPDSLDLLLICVDSGMSIEQGFRRVAEEVGSQSVALAEELSLTTAELSYLPSRRMAYDNLAKRVNMDVIKNLCLALTQAERYGTPVGNTLRVLAQESRDTRMMEAERKAAALSAKLTVPTMIFFFFPLFVVILVPVIVKAIDILKG